MEWQPIETAPKDGTRVLLFEKYSEVPFVGRWISFKRGSEWSADTEHLNTSGDDIIIDWYEQSDVAHWMPLPKPPNERNNCGGFQY